MNETNKLKNRIVGYDSKPAKDFRLHPLNPKTHPPVQQKAVAAILEEVGWVKGVIENRRTGFIVDGEARILESLKLNPDEVIPYTIIDVTEEEEKKILAFLDYIAGLAIIETDKLNELLNALDFESETLGQLAAGLAGEELNLDEFFHPELPEEPAEKFSIILEFDSAEEYKAFADALAEIDSDPKDAVRQLLKLEV